MDPFARRYLEYGFEFVTGSIATVVFPPVERWVADWVDQSQTSLELIDTTGERSPARIGNLYPQWSTLVSADHGFGMMAGSYLGLDQQSIKFINTTIAAGQVAAALMHLW